MKNNTFLPQQNNALFLFPFAPLDPTSTNGLTNPCPNNRLPQSKGVEIASFDWEAKEFLRKRLIGKTVHVTIDYVKPPSDQFPETTECATIKVGEINVGEQLVLKGLADVIKSRDDRSQYYDQLLVAEAK